jgi:hypothetical protein
MAVESRSQLESGIQASSRWKCVKIGIRKGVRPNMSCHSMENTDAEPDDKGRVHLAAACGTYCGACPAYIAKHCEDDRIRMKRRERSSSEATNELKTIPDPSWMDGLRCDGCLSGGELPPHCRDCSIRVCAANKLNDARCTECDELPCYRIADLIAVGFLHRGEYLPNLAKMREMGVQKWIEYEEERWRCPQCGLPMSWYDAKCARCGEARSGRLFPLTEDSALP